LFLLFLLCCCSGCCYCHLSSLFLHNCDLCDIMMLRYKGWRSDRSTMTLSSMPFPNKFYACKALVFLELSVTFPLKFVLTPVLIPASLLLYFQQFFNHCGVYSNTVPDITNFLCSVVTNHMTK
jgi:hypothetical protein